MYIVRTNASLKTLIIILITQTSAEAETCNVATNPRTRFATHHVSLLID